MRSEQIITAIDIGTTKICVIIAVLDEEKKLEIKGIGTGKSEGLVNGIVIDISKASKSISDAIYEAELMSETKAKNIYVGIAGEHMKSQNTLGRISLTTGSEPCEITQEHVDNVITNSKNNIKIQQGNERLDIIHAIPQYYDIDGQVGIMNPVNMSGFNLSAYVHIVMADINTIRNITKCVELSGYKVEEIFLEPIASSYSVLNEVEKTLGSVLIDIGGGTTDLAVFYKESIRFSAVIPLGGTNITQDLAIGLQTSPQNAEDLKINYGNSIASSVPDDENIKIEGIAGRESKTRKLRYVSEIIEARMREILEDAYKILNEHNELKMITAGLTITGGASLLKNSEKLAEDIFNMSTKTGYPDLSGLAGPTERLQNPKYATSVGILYQAQNLVLDKDNKIRQLKTSDPFTSFFKKIIASLKEYL
ncbi:MAG TPA: cell division protein FtsA [Candidatus Cloacimonetes bacterium]|nr:cell division protein FtsA [Candidatus Cloacimonadota bacterium]